MPPLSREFRRLGLPPQRPTNRKYDRRYTVYLAKSLP
jgi:hypothetical protein